jgi:hypothetical protein
MQQSIISPTAKVPRNLQRSKINNECLSMVSPQKTVRFIFLPKSYAFSLSKTTALNFKRRALKTTLLTQKMFCSENL